MGCLAEMTVAHPTSGSFGAYAEHYISPLAGFTVRYAYWAAVVLAVGMEVEYGFSMVKIIAIVAFILIGAWVVFGSQPQGIGFSITRPMAASSRKGLWGTWVAVIIAIFSYLSLEAVAVAAGEAEDPSAPSPGLSHHHGAPGDLLPGHDRADAGHRALAAGRHGQEPFVKVMEIIGIPGAASIINFVVLVAALSAMNSQLYVTSRMMFSLSRGGYAPSVFRAAEQPGVPWRPLPSPAWALPWPWP
ncbi:Nuclear factor NF-kappa-B p100 subunit [Manis javanica]|nr:Nuclear factor NF-kappa-B p100 subunit [Manis javanica]